MHPACRMAMQLSTDLLISNKGPLKSALFSGDKLKSEIKEHTHSILFSKLEEGLVPSAEPLLEKLRTLAES